MTQSSIAFRVGPGESPLRFLDANGLGILNPDALRSWALVGRLVESINRFANIGRPSPWLACQKNAFIRSQSARTLVNSMRAGVVRSVLGALRARQDAWLRSVGGIKVLAKAWASITAGRSLEPPPDSESIDLATPEQLAAVVDAVTHAAEPAHNR